MASQAAAAATHPNLVPRFPFPRKAVLRPVVPPVSLPVAVRKDPKYHRLEPNLKHAGVKWLPSSWSWGKFRGGKKVEFLSRRNRKTLEQQGRPTDFVEPMDRIRQWNLGPGDRVRVLSGDDEIKFIDPKVGKKSGWKIYVVKRIDQRTNRVYFFQNTTSLEAELKPPQWKEWSPQRRAEWLQEQDREREQGNQATKRNVSYHYSDLGLLMATREDAADHVWAKRVRCTTPKWDEKQLQWTWDRYGVYRDPKTGKRGVAKIEWPMKTDPAEKYKAGQSETREDVVKQITLSAMAGSELLEYSGIIEDLIPSTLRSPPPRGERVRWAPDEYLRIDNPSMDIESPDNKTTEEERFMDLIMPLYLGEELSPRFSSWKKELAFHQRQALFADQKDEFIQKAVDEWELNGKDRHLRETMDTSQAALSGVPIKPRSRKEVIEAAEIEYKSVLTQNLRDKARQITKGKKWDYEQEQWLATKVSKRKERKVRRKKEKEVEKLQRLDSLQLKESKNQVLPPGLSLKGEQKLPVRTSA